MLRVALAIAIKTRAIARTIGTSSYAIMGKWVDDPSDVGHVRYAPYATNIAMHDANGARGANELGCRNCGELGHYARACPRARAPTTDRCNRCGAIGHWARDCAVPDTRTNAAGGGAPYANAPQVYAMRGMAKVNDRCSRCAGFGHYARECPTPALARVGPGAMYVRQGDGRGCHNCGKPGHFARECRAGGDARGYDQGARGRSDVSRGTRMRNATTDDVCHRCNASGHWAKDCPMPDERPEGERGRAAGDKDKCRNCGEIGHFARECALPRDTACRLCKQQGHFARECPNATAAAANAAATMDADLDNYMKAGAAETGEVGA